MRKSALLPTLALAGVLTLPSEPARANNGAVAVAVIGGLVVAGLLIAATTRTAARPAPAVAPAPRVAPRRSVRPRRAVRSGYVAPAPAYARYPYRWGPTVHVGYGYAAAYPGW